MISFIVPVYNAAAFLEKCVESLRIQRAALEIILVDDGSTDESGAICDRCAAQDPRIRAIHKPNGGAAAARNAGLDAAKGEYVWFVDSDDWIEPDAAEALLRIADAARADVTVFGMVSDYVDDGVNVPIVPPRAEAGVYRGAAEIPRAILTMERHGLMPFFLNKLYRRSFLEREQARLQEVSVPIEDILFQMSFIHNAEVIAVVDRVFYHYVQVNSASLVRRYYDNLFEIMQDVNQRRRALYRQLGLTDEDARNVSAMNCVHQLMHSVKNLYRRSTPEVRAMRRPVWRQILHDPVIRDDVRRSRSRLTEAKLLQIALWSRSATLANAFFAALMFARTHLQPVYRPLRKVLFLRSDA